MAFTVPAENLPTAFLPSARIRIAVRTQPSLRSIALSHSGERGFRIAEARTPPELCPAHPADECDRSTRLLAVTLLSGLLTQLGPFP
jgi:hypothetical protein